MSARFLLTTFGSFGDLHPYLAVGLRLRERGHHVTIGTSELYRAKVESEGLHFRAVRPAFEKVLDDPRELEKAIHPRKGPRYLLRHLMMPPIRETYEDTLAAAREADLVVGHPIAFAVPTACEVLRKPWVSVALQPSVFLSAYDPPVLSGAPHLAHFRGLGPWFWRPMFALARRTVRLWGKPLNKLRQSLGLKPLPNPLLDDMVSPWGAQAWFSRILARPQADWPAHLTVTGFPFYDRLGGQESGGENSGLTPQLEEFLAAGPPPVVFTLGSSAVFAAGNFFHESVEAAKQAGVRAVLLIGRDPRNIPRENLPAGIIAAEYAPYSQLLPRAAATVHQGGIGTTAQALRAGRPSLIVPWSHDQPDNARRVEQLGAGRTLPRSKYRASRVAALLRTLLVNTEYRDAAQHAAEIIATEDGAGTACTALEAALNQSRL